MLCYVQPTLNRWTSGIAISHVGTNDLTEEKDKKESPMEIADSSFGKKQKI